MCKECEEEKKLQEKKKPLPNRREVELFAALVLIGLAYLLLVDVIW